MALDQYILDTSELENTHVHALASVLCVCVSSFITGISKITVLKV